MSKHRHSSSHTIWFWTIQTCSFSSILNSYMFHIEVFSLDCLSTKFQLVTRFSVFSRSVSVVGFPSTYTSTAFYSLLHLLHFHWQFNYFQSFHWNVFILYNLTKTMTAFSLHVSTDILTAFRLYTSVILQLLFTLTMTVWLLSKLTIQPELKCFLCFFAWTAVTCYLLTFQLLSSSTLQLTVQLLSLLTDWHFNSVLCITIYIKMKWSVTDCQFCVF